MNNSIFENSTKAIFGKGRAKEYLHRPPNGCGDRIMLACGGSIKKDVLDITKEAAA